MCTITINAPLVSATQISTGGTNVFVSGTVSNCTSGQITVSVDLCPGGLYSGVALISGNTWTALIKTDCQCDQPVVIQATCQDAIPCTATYSGQLKCYLPACCPMVIKNKAEMGVWNAQGHQLVTFETKLNVPAGCNVTVQRDYGDGTFGAVKSLSSGISTYWESHPYSGGNYTSKLNILSPLGCGLYTVPVSVSPVIPACADPNLSWIQSVCLALAMFFLISAAAGGAILCWSAIPGCVSISPTLFQTALIMLIAGYVLLTIMYLTCNECVCALIIKMWGEQFLATGAVISVFGFSGGCPGAYGISIGGMAIGAGIILTGLWYGTNAYRYICPLNICDFWQAIADSYFAALLAVVIVFAMTGVSIIGLILALAMIIGAMVAANGAKMVNQSQGNC